MCGGVVVGGLVAFGAFAFSVGITAVCLAKAAQRPKRQVAIEMLLRELAWVEHPL